MSRHYFSTAPLACFVLIASLCLAVDVAARDHDAAEQLVAEALHREIYGLHADRKRLLVAAVAADPNYAPARWHQGFVRVGSEWSHVYDAPRMIGESSQLNAYRELRGKCDDTLEDHLQLADWCRNQRMPVQARAHLTRVLDFNAEHADARERLGFQLTNGQWVETGAAARQAAQLVQRQQALEDWRATMIELRKALSDSKPATREDAAARIRAITSATAIPAFEEILSPHSQLASQLVLESLAQMPESEAVESLVRHAVLSPWLEVRDGAALRLKSRPPESFVPLLLAEMYSPVESRTTIVPVGGRLVYQHAFARDAQNQRQVLVFNSVYRRRAVSGGDGSDSFSRALADSFFTATRLQQTAEQQNAWTRAINERIARALNLATQQNLPATPQAWWQWWNEQNDVVLQGAKPIREQQFARQVMVQDQARAQIVSAGNQGVTSAPQQRRGECFAAGTPVWTAAGMLPIESIRVGDIVLSQNIESGELAYRPVLRTTIRPVERLVKIRVGNESFETSGGHLFWVAGQGWSQARELESGHSLHAIEGAVPVVSVEPGTEAQTYNLVVADFNTYVVGAGKILSHDVTDRRPTRTIVPGFPE